MHPWFSLIRLRVVTFAAASGLLLSGCAGGAGAYDANLSPAQNQLRQSNARFNQTVGEGAVAGALLGGAAGLAFGGRNRAQATLIGATAGGALGAGAGYAVARNNLNRASTEAQFNDAIQQAGAEAQVYREAAASSAQIADDANADAAKLRTQYHANQISQAQYRAGLAKFQIDNDALLNHIQKARQASATIRQESQVASGSNRAQLANSAADIERSTRQAEQNQLRLSHAMAGEA